MKFEWDENKNKANKLKHDVSFEQASTVFDDDNAIYIDDIEHSIYEERFIVIGLDIEKHTLTVCYCYRGKDEDIIILENEKICTTSKSRPHHRKRSPSPVRGGFGYSFLASPERGGGPPKRWWGSPGVYSLLFFSLSSIE